MSGIPPIRNHVSCGAPSIHPGGDSDASSHVLVHFSHVFECWGWRIRSEHIAGIPVRLSTAAHRGTLLLAFHVLHRRLLKGPSLTILRPVIPAIQGFPRKRA
jgi:hypothetical protein